MQINYGDIFHLGNHRLMCGDATNRDDVCKLIDGRHVNLVLTDPPYGIKIINRNSPKMGSRGRVYAEVIGDTNSDMIKEHYKIIRGICNNLIIWGGQNFTDFLPNLGNGILQTGNYLIIPLKSFRISFNSCFNINFSSNFYK